MSLPHVIARGALVLLRLVLAAYPAAFRRQFTTEVMRGLRVELASAAAIGGVPVVRASIRALVTTIRDLLAEHISNVAGAARRSATRKERRMIEGLGSDARLAARRLRSQPLLTVAVDHHARSGGRRLHRHLQRGGRRAARAVAASRWRPSRLA